MKIKLLFIAFLNLSFISIVHSQNYLLTPYKLDVVGMPGDFLLGGVTVSNPGTVDVNIFMTRIEKNLPSGWESCFCAPFCLVTTQDTLSWTIAPGTSIDIAPNFQTDLVPGFGTVKIELLNLTTGSAADTITFTGSTLSSGIAEINSYIKLYPNPANDLLLIDVPGRNLYQLFIFDMSGKEIYFSKTQDKSISLHNISSGEYVVRLKFENEIFERKISIVKQ